jgi:hypothetical protein
MALWDTVCTASPLTNLYLNDKSHNHPSNKQMVLSTLMPRTRAICDEDSQQALLVTLRDVFKQNGCDDWQICRSPNRRPHLEQPDNKPDSDATLPFVRNIFSQIGSVLA